MIFDMDGVLIDSVRTGLQVRKQLLANYGVDLDTVPDPQGEGHRAASLKTLLTSVEKHSGVHVDHEEFKQLSQKHMYQQLKNSGAAADPALVSLLKELRRHDILCAITSSSLQESVDNKLKILGIKPYFSVIITGSDAQEHKPHPEGYLLTLAKLRLSPNQCIIVEDTKTGVEAGLAAGCRVIGFTQYNPSRETLEGTIANIAHWHDLTYETLVKLDTKS